MGSIPYTYGKTISVFPSINSIDILQDFQSFIESPMANEEFGALVEELQQARSDGTG